MNILVASDSFKGTFSSMEIGEMVRRKFANDTVHVIAISDGGEGFCDAACHALGGTPVSLTVHDPLMRPIEAHCCIASSGIAIVEMAQASGLTLLSPSERNPLLTSTYGTGELIRHAILHGHRQIVVGLGGSATNDCGSGLLDALADTRHLLHDCHITIASDVTSPLCGPLGATYVFARQKGADKSMLPLLEQRNMEFGRRLEEQTGRSIINTPGAGAAGGTGAALLSLPHTTITPGIDLMLNWQRFDQLVPHADIVITGEGCLDRQTLLGKAPFVIAQRTKHFGVPCIALCGRNELTPEELSASPFAEVHTLTEWGL